MDSSPSWMTPNSPVQVRFGSSGPIIFYLEGVVQWIDMNDQIVHVCISDSPTAIAQKLNGETMPVEMSRIFPPNHFDTIAESAPPTPQEDTVMWEGDGNRSARSLMSWNSLSSLYDLWASSKWKLTSPNTSMWIKGPSSNALLASMPDLFRDLSERLFDEEFEMDCDDNDEDPLSMNSLNESIFHSSDLILADDDALEEDEDFLGHAVGDRVDVRVGSQWCEGEIMQRINGGENYVVKFDGSCSTPERQFWSSEVRKLA